MKYFHTKKGFTLMELIISLAVIGFLAVIIVGFLSDSRSKGKDATIKNTLANLRSQASIYFNLNNGDYDGICTTSQAVNPKGIQDFVTSLESLSTDVTCDDNSSGWAIEALLNQDSVYACVDDSGEMILTDATSGISPTDPECDGTSGS